MMAVPVVVAPSSRVQWIDDGPPKTDSAPGSASQRYYRVVQLATAMNASAMNDPFLSAAPSCKLPNSNSPLRWPQP